MLLVPRILVLIVCFFGNLLVTSGQPRDFLEHDPSDRLPPRREPGLLAPADDKRFAEYLAMPENKLLKRRIQLQTTDQRGNSSAVVRWDASITGPFELGIAFPTNGWLAFGFPLSDDVVGSDVLFACYDAEKDQVIVQDRYVVNRSNENVLEMSIDKKQDWTILHGSVNATHMFVRVMRQPDTGDDMDRIIWNRPANIFYAYGLTPVGPSETTLTYDALGWTVVNLYDTIPPPNPFQKYINDEKLPTNILIHGSDKTGDRRLVIGYGSNSTHVKVSLLFPTRGWMAFGLSPDGKMEDSDIVFIYTNESNGRIQMQDRYISANRTAKKIDLLIDQQQDWVFENYGYNDTHTLARITRKLNTGDKWDRVIQDEDTFAIYAYGLKAPLKADAFVGKHDFRGITSINLLRTGQSSWFKEEVIKDNRPQNDPLIVFILKLKERGFPLPWPMRKPAVLPSTLDVKTDDNHHSGHHFTEHKQSRTRNEVIKS